MALEEARDNALKLSDGRRVYFTRDGHRLFDEEGNEITDETAIAEARRRLQENPNATGYEDYKDRYNRYDDAAKRAEHLADVLDRLDNLNRRFRSGEITADELAQRRTELEQIIDTMPPAARHEYDRMREEREGASGPAYKGAGQAIESAPNVNDQFVRANETFREKAAEAKSEPDSDSDREPVYKLPEF